MEVLVQSCSLSVDDCVRESYPKPAFLQRSYSVKGTIETEHEYQRTSTEALEQRWKDYFRDPSQWLDKRESKTAPRVPDFQHSTSGQPLWIYSWSNPPWVQEELRKRGLVSLPESLSFKNGAVCSDKPTETENTMERYHVADAKEKKEEKAEDDEEVMTSTGSALISQGNGGLCLSYDVLLKNCAQQKDLQRGTRLHGELVQKGLLEHDTFAGSSLVNMYIKCGDLLSAKDVFDKLPVRNLVSWNAMIGGYAQHGQGEHALSLFEEMQQDAFSPDKITFVCVLKACGFMNTVEKGKEIHARISRYETLSRDTTVGTALVDMYGRFGMLSMAQEVFDSLPVRNVVTWNALIARYSDNGRDNDALCCFDLMLQSGISPSPLSFLSTFKACGSLELLDFGQEVHAILVRKGFTEADMVVGVALADMYIKCSAFTKAEQVFRELPATNVVSWNVLIAGYTQHGFGEEVLYLYEQMQLVGVPSDDITITCILKACGSIEALDKGQEIHNQIACDGVFENEISVAGALVDMYVKCGALDEALEESRDLPERNAVLWTTLIAGLTNHECAEKALDCYEQMLSEGFLPDIVTFACILKACGMAGALEKGKEVHAQIMKESSLAMDTIIGTAVVDMYARCGLLAKAQEVFDSLPSPSVITWNALIAGYVQHSLNEKALDRFECMQREGFVPDSITFLSTLRACGSLEAMHLGQEIHVECVKDGLLDEDATLGTALVDMHARCGMLADAQETFDELPVLDVVSWNALITGYAQHSWEEALRCFEELQRLGFSPNQVTFISIFRACCNLGVLDIGLQVHSQAVKQGLVEEDMAVNIVLVDMYSNLGMLAEARLLFDRLPSKDSALWNVLLSGYAQSGKEKTIFGLFEKMKADGIEPDAFTFTILLNTCSHEGLVCNGELLYLTMCMVYNLLPSLEHVACIVDLLCRAGQVEKAVGIVLMASFSNDATIWHTVLAACKRWHITDLGTWAFNQAVQLDERSPAPYVCLSNIVATTGKREFKKYESMSVNSPSWISLGFLGEEM